MSVVRFTTLALAAASILVMPVAMAQQGPTSSGSAYGNGANGVSHASGTRAVGTGNAQGAGTGNGAAVGVRGTGAVGNTGAAPDRN